mmetsp:Transcript_30512/g.22631  ORF Transcript_30512/g.22631 Transcript_30512/m.22631 type:complete len:85 (-) Transcript_30512:146-400(-)
MITVPNLAFFVYWAFFMVIEGLKVSHRAGPRCFSIVTCSFGNYEKFREKYMEKKVERVQEEEVSPKTFEKNPEIIKKKRSARQF